MVISHACPSQPLCPVPHQLAPGPNPNQPWRFCFTCYVGRVNGAITCSCLRTRNDGWLSGKCIKLQSKRVAPLHMRERERSPFTSCILRRYFPSHASHQHNSQVTRCQPPYSENLFNRVQPFIHSTNTYWEPFKWQHSVLEAGDTK